MMFNGMYVKYFPFNLKGTKGGIAEYITIRSSVKGFEKFLFPVTGRVEIQERKKEEDL